MKQERIPYKGTTLLPVKKDLVFKAVFANENDLEPLASLLSSILEMDLTEQDITLANAEIAPVYGTGKLPRLDIRVKIGEGNDSKHVDVEIQMHEKKDLEKRSLYYLSRLYTNQVGKGMEYKTICPAVAINILDYNFLPFDEYHNRYRMKNMDREHELTDVFEIDFIELGKIPAKAATEKADNMKDLWMQYLTAESEEVIQMLREQSPILEKAVNRLVYISADEQLRYELDMREKAELDYWSDLAESREQGLEQGRQQEKLHLAKSLLADGISIEKVIQYTGLTADEIHQLNR